jgi:hypothetical protein
MRGVSRSPAAVGAVLIGALFVLQAWLLAGPRVGEARFLPPPRETAPSIEIFGERDLLFTFVSHADGLRSVTIYPRAVGGTLRGRVLLRLEGGGGVQDAVVPAEAIVARDEWTWHVAPVARAAGYPFALRVRAPDSVEGQGLQLATGPPNYVDGELFIGGRPQWGDLKFETRASGARAFDRLAGLYARDLPRLLVSGLALLCLNLALAHLGRMLLASD